MMSKTTLIIDTDNNTVEKLQDGYNIVEKTYYDEDIMAVANNLLNRINESDNPFKTYRNTASNIPVEYQRAYYNDEL